MLTRLAPQSTRAVTLVKRRHQRIARACISQQTCRFVHQLIPMRNTPAQMHQTRTVKAAAYASAPLGAADEHANEQPESHAAFWVVGTLLKTLAIWMGGIVGLLLGLFKTYDSLGHAPARHSMCRGPRFFRRVDRRALPVPTVVEGQTSGFIRANGVDLFHVRAGQGDGKKLMLFVHGFPECWYTWRYQLPVCMHD